MVNLTLIHPQAGDLLPAAFLSQTFTTASSARLLAPMDQTICSIDRTLPEAGCEYPLSSIFAKSVRHALIPLRTNGQNETGSLRWGNPH
ncbi:MAG: hypothetical protein KatS3mg111_4202 [Pirellulaceae bacterium]|nr:MAG: hypothetical protein KatS3mg111_4202 [Pirellulaceae bacterium]